MKSLARFVITYTPTLGSISAFLSSPVYVPPREESSGEECELLSRTAAGNRAYPPHPLPFKKIIILPALGIPWIDYSVSAFKQRKSSFEWY